MFSYLLVKILCRLLIVSDKPISSNWSNSVLSDWFQTISVCRVLYSLEIRAVEPVISTVARAPIQSTILKTTFRVFIFVCLRFNDHVLLRFPRRTRLFYNAILSRTTKTLRSELHITISIRRNHAIRVRTVETLNVFPTIVHGPRAC